METSPIRPDDRCRAHRWARDLAELAEWKGDFGRQQAIASK
jgi:hypothetical protein